MKSHPDDAAQYEAIASKFVKDKEELERIMESYVSILKSKKPSWEDKAFPVEDWKKAVTTTAMPRGADWDDFLKGLPPVEAKPVFPTIRPAKLSKKDRWDFLVKQLEATFEKLEALEKEPDDE